jgi:hypothetical protein
MCVTDKLRGREASGGGGTHAPGVSMMSRPGSFTSSLSSALRAAVRVSMVLLGKKVAPICCVMPPASPSCAWMR